jgi:hypothetical protein
MKIPKVIIDYYDRDQRLHTGLLDAERLRRVRVRHGDQTVWVQDINIRRRYAVRT